MAIGLHNLKPAKGSRRRYKRVGRGNASGKGTTAGKGTKGQRARQGGRKGLRQLGQKRATQSTPKLAGFAPVQKKAVDLRVSVLNAFENGSTVTVATLKARGFVPGATEAVKLVDGGKVSKKLTARGLLVSAGAKKAIEAAGGAVVS